MRSARTSAGRGWIRTSSGASSSATRRGAGRVLLQANLYSRADRRDARQRLRDRPGGVHQSPHGRTDGREHHADQRADRRASDGRRSPGDVRHGPGRARGGPADRRSGRAGELPKSYRFPTLCSFRKYWLARPTLPEVAAARATSKSSTARARWSSTRTDFCSPSRPRV